MYDTQHLTGTEPCYPITLNDYNETNIINYMPEKVAITFEDGSIHIPEDIEGLEDLRTTIEPFSPSEGAHDSRYDETALANALTDEINSILQTSEDPRTAIRLRGQLIDESMSIGLERASEYKQRAIAAKKVQEFQDSRDLSSASFSQQVNNRPNIGELVRNREITPGNLLNYLFLTWGLERKEYEEMTVPYYTAEAQRENVLSSQRELNCSIILNLAIQNVSLSHYLVDHENYIPDSINLLLLTARALQLTPPAQRVDRLAEAAGILGQYITFHFEADNYEDPLYRNMLYLAKAIGLEVAEILQVNPELFRDTDPEQTAIAMLNAKTIASWESFLGLLPASIGELDLLSLLMQAATSKTWKDSNYRLRYENQYAIAVRNHLLPGDPTLDNIDQLAIPRGDKVHRQIGNMASLLLAQIEKTFESNTPS